MPTYSVQNLQCNVCNKTFSHSGNLKTHMRIHTGDLPFQCNVCQKKFTHSGNLKVHMRIHTGEQPFECPICHKRFSHSGNLKTHSLLHIGGNRFKCNICQRTFNLAYQLKRHIVRVHRGVKLDNEAFSFAFSLNGLRKREGSERCVFCNRIFNSQKAIEDHVRCHIQERPFFCKLCGKEFGTIRRRDFHFKKHRDNAQSSNEREQPLFKEEITNEVGSNEIPHSSPTRNESFLREYDLIEYHRIDKIPTILVQHSIAILGAVIGFEQSDSSVLVISTNHVSITYQKLQRTIPHFPIFHEPEDCFNSLHVVKALVCEENYENILITANKMNKKITLVINATEEAIKEKVQQLRDNKIRVISDKFQWSDLTVTLQFQVLQNWKKKFGFSLNSEQMDYIEGEFLISLVYDKDFKTLQYYMPLELKRCVNKMRQNQIARA